MLWRAQTFAITALVTRREVSVSVATQQPILPAEKTLALRIMPKITLGPRRPKQVAEIVALLVPARAPAQRANKLGEFSGVVS